MIFAALACVDFLFSEQVLANGNLSGAKGFATLDVVKMSFLKSCLRDKFFSDQFEAQWCEVQTKLTQSAEASAEQSCVGFSVVCLKIERDMPMLDV